MIPDVDFTFLIGAAVQIDEFAKAQVLKDAIYIQTFYATLTEGSFARQAKNGTYP